MSDVRHNQPESRYELDTEHGVAITVYRQHGDRLVFVHTETPPADEGKGIASRLVRAALEDAHARGFKIEPACSFVIDFVRHNPQYRDD
jgi:predicted GNAT family acetyltransferase